MNVINNEEEQNEIQQLKADRMRRRMKFEKDFIFYKKILKYLFYIYCTVLIILIVFKNSQDNKFDFKGKVEDSCQDLQTLQNINQKIYPLIHEITNKKFFRLFRVNLQNECPFWVGNYICSNKKCAVCECNKKDIPLNWLKPQSDSIQQLNVDQTYWESERDNNISQWVWHVEDTQNDKGVYVDLKINPESYTGYQGSHIWETIYNENCFQGQVCKEERALNKMISGLHASISTQLSEYYVDITNNKTIPQYNLYFEKVAKHPDRIKNLFFLYSVLLRAFNLAQPIIQQYDINSMKFEEDMQAKQLINDIYQITLSQCSHPFDEKQFFKEIKFETKKQYQKYIHNISMIMDCVECEKCKVYGKMQTYGLGTALKILFSDSPEVFQGNIKRNELIAFVNTLAKISSSINSITLMFERRSKFRENLVIVFAVIGAFIQIFLFCMLKIFQNMNTKFRKMFNGIQFQQNTHKYTSKIKND